MAGFARCRRVGMAISTHGLLLLVSQSSVERIAELGCQCLNMDVVLAGPIRIGRTSASRPVIGIADCGIVTAVAAVTGTDHRRAGDAVNRPTRVAEVEDTRGVAGCTVTRRGVVGGAGVVNLDAAVTMPTVASRR